MLQLLSVGAGGFVGSILRYWLSGVMHRWLDNGFPVGTFVVNSLGCLAAGVVWGLVDYRDWLTAEQRMFIIVGILGGFTTFSAFGHETFMLMRDGKHLSALANVAANVLFDRGELRLVGRQGFSLMRIHTRYVKGVS